MNHAAAIPPMIVCPTTVGEDAWQPYFVGMLALQRHVAAERRVKPSYMHDVPLDHAGLENARIAWAMYCDGVLLLTQRRGPHGSMEYLCRRRMPPSPKVLPIRLR